jgi:hypothetical protein
VGNLSTPYTSHAGDIAIPDAFDSALNPILPNGYKWQNAPAVFDEDISSGNIYSRNATWSQAPLKSGRWESLSSKRIHRQTFVPEEAYIYDPHYMGGAAPGPVMPAYESLIETRASLGNFTAIGNIGGKIFGHATGIRVSEGIPGYAYLNPTTAAQAAYSHSWTTHLPDDFFTFPFTNLGTDDDATISTIKCDDDDYTVITTTTPHPFKRNDLVVIEGGMVGTDQEWFNQCFEVTHGPGDQVIAGVLGDNEFAIAFYSSAIGAILAGLTMSVNQAAFQVWFQHVGYSGDSIHANAWPAHAISITYRGGPPNGIQGYNNANAETVFSNQVVSEGFSPNVWGVGGPGHPLSPRNPNFTGGQWQSVGIKSKDLLTAFGPSSFGPSKGWANHHGGQLIKIQVQAKTSIDVGLNTNRPITIGPVVMSAHCVKIVPWE